MSWTESDLTALNKAIGEGVKKVAYRDRTIEYRDLGEMLSLKNMMEIEIGKVSRSTRVYPSTSKGL